MMMREYARGIRCVSVYAGALAALGSLRPSGEETHLAAGVRVTVQRELGSNEGTQGYPRGHLSSR